MSDWPNPNAVNITLLKGDAGATGATGAAGSNGVTPYIFIGYAEDASGTNPSYTSPTGKSHFRIVVGFGGTTYDGNDASTYAPYGVNPMTTAAFAAMEALGGTTWVDFTEDIATLWNSISWNLMPFSEGGGWTSASYYRKVGNLMEFKGSFSRSGSSIVANATTFTEVVTMPVGYRPTVARWFTCSQFQNVVGGSVFVTVGYINTDGKVYISNMNGIAANDVFRIDNIGVYLTTA